MKRTSILCILIFISLISFSKKSKNHRVFESFKNVYFSSYESLESLNKETLFHNHIDIITKLTNNLRTEKVRELE